MVNREVLARKFEFTRDLVDLLSSYVSSVTGEKRAVVRDVLSYLKRLETHYRRRIVYLCKRDQILKEHERYILSFSWRFEGLINKNIGLLGYLSRVRVEEDELVDIAFDDPFEKKEFIKNCKCFLRDNLLMGRIAYALEQKEARLFREASKKGYVEWGCLTTEDDFPEGRIEEFIRREIGI